MYKILFFASVFVATASANYGGGYGMGYAVGPGPLAVHTRQSVAYIPTASSGYAAPTAVAIDGQAPPLAIQYRTFSSPVSINHVHVPGQGSFRATASVDPAHVRVHTVTKPIVQQLNEIVVPRRLIRQQILPVQEQVQTIVARQAPVAVRAAPVAFAAAAPVALIGGGAFGGFGGHAFLG
ncbi:hypothetical protein TYRP_019429 [Tyrophagus putrescentiae]|nr:hypothetical protein TYRP_019429 [Tyrophagus putrescentiae]